MLQEKHLTFYTHFSVAIFMLQFVTSIHTYSVLRHSCMCVWEWKLNVISAETNAQRQIIYKIRCEYKHDYMCTWLNETHFGPLNMCHLYKYFHSIYEMHHSWVCCYTSFHFWHRFHRFCGRMTESWILFYWKFMICARVLS